MVAIHLYPTPSDPTGTDLFCGAGGLSIGAEDAGLRVKLGVNHWPRACETYEANHPWAQVECADLQQTLPERYAAIVSDILLGSPECRFMSPAQGKQLTNAKQLRMFYSCEYDPQAIRSRATMYEMLHFLEVFHYRYVVLENVVEALKWDQFTDWLRAMDRVKPGYRHRLLFLNSMFFGAPQSRDRMYIVLWRKDMPEPDLTFMPQALCWKCQAVVESVQSWKRPNTQHGKYGRNGQYVYRCPRCAQEVIPFFLPAMSAIDWSIPATRICDRKEPLAPKTMERIRLGFAKYRQQQARTWEPGQAEQPASHPPAGRMPPQIVEFRNHMNTRSIAQALTTVTAQADHHGMVTPPGWLAKQYSGVTSLHPVDLEPTGSITTIDHHALITPPAVLLQNGFGYGTSSGHASRTRAPDADPFWAITGHSRLSLVTPPLVVKVDRSRDARPATTEPLWTVTSGGNHLFCVLPSWLVPYYGTSQSLRDVFQEPSGTVTGHDRFGLLAAQEMPFALDDCAFRMLAPVEIQRAMSFPNAYQILGNHSEVIKQLGHGVTPPVARWIVERILEAMVGKARLFDPSQHILQTWQEMVAPLGVLEQGVQQLQ
ncbi:MAG: DNA cytosine methyltransferase [Ktedonobacterales bacterium]|nr:DNA cytosine methyltransferase [Ktedonobacterales bacterium]